MATAATVEEVEAKLAEALAEMGSDPAGFSRDASFEELDVDSLDLVELVQVAEDEWGVRLEGEDVKHLCTIGEVVDLVVARSG